MICFRIPGESSEVSELEESRALREQLSPSHMDRNQPRVKQASLTERVGVTQGGHTFSGQGQAVEQYLHLSICDTNVILVEILSSEITKCSGGII